jgi:hypothetical protein
MPNEKRVRKTRKRVKPKRKIFPMDQVTLTDLGVVQSALGATSSAEAIRVSVRKMADLVRRTNNGYEIHAVDPKSVNPSVILDIPTRNAGNEVKPNEDRTESEQ